MNKTDSIRISDMKLLPNLEVTGIHFDLLGNIVRLRGRYRHKRV